MMTSKSYLTAALAALLSGVLWMPTANLQAASAQAQAQEILQATGVSGGLVVHLGCGAGELTVALHANDRFIVQGLDAKAANVAQTRAAAVAQNLAGPVSATVLSGNKLPYLDNLARLVVVEDLAGVPMTEVMRVLTPLGVAYVKNGGQWTKTVKDWPKEIDEWTHYLHDTDNNAVAHDKEVGPPKGLQWVTGPLYCRSHETDSSVSALVSARGRIFYILDDGPTGVADERLPQKWALYARDAFSGVFLWKVPLPNWGWPEWKKNELAGVDWTTVQGHRLRSPEVLPRRLVTDGQRVYITLGYNAPVTVLDAATGQTLRTIAGTESTDEILCHDGTLVICTRQEHEKGDAAKGGKAGARKGKKKASLAVAASQTTATTDHIIAIKAETGQVLWDNKVGAVVPLCLAVSGQKVYYHDFQKLICLDLASGKQAWQAGGEAPHGNLYSGPNSLVVQNGVVFFSDSQSLQAFAADSGKALWRHTGAKGPGISNPPDLFVTGGFVWSGLSTDGLDPLTGVIKKKLDLQQLINPWHHYRCYRSKATDRFLIWPKQGAEFIDLDGSDNMRHDWFRGPCKYGIMPANGFTYSAPHQCSCFAGVKLNGFNVLSATSSAPREEAPAESRLEKGPAYSEIANAKVENSSPEDWPTFRGDAKRSGASPSAVAPEVKTVWQAKLSGKLSQPVLAIGKIFVASINAGQVICVDAKDGRTVWTFTAGSRVDSAPTIVGGLALFGCADGWVYCVRASDGVLGWRFRAAPAERHLVAMDRVESVWPVHGTVLVHQGKAYVVAGRSTFLDGGLWLSALDPASGKLLHQARLEGPYPDVTKDNGGSREMQGARTEVLVTDGTSIYLRQAKFNAALQLQGPWTTQLPGKEFAGVRLTSTSDLLDDSGFNRTSWHYGNWITAQGGGNSGQLLVFNDTTTFAAQIFSKHVAQSEVYFPGKGYVKLFALANPVFDEEAAAAGKGKKKGFKTGARSWEATIPIYVRAMTLAGPTIFVGGMPDTLDPKDPLAVLEGRAGGILAAYSAADGKQLSQLKLDAPPVFDGVIAAGGKLYIAQTDGRVLCLEGK